MDWRAFVHDHAVVVLLSAMVLVVVLVIVILASLPSRAHMLKIAFLLLAWLAIAICMGLIFVDLDLFPLLGIASKDTLLALMASAVIVTVILMWRIGSWWAEHADLERKDLMSRLNEAQKAVTLTLSANKS